MPALRYDPELTVFEKINNKVTGMHLFIYERRIWYEYLNVIIFVGLVS